MKTAPNMQILNENDEEIVYQSDELPDLAMRDIYNMTKEMHVLSKKYEETYKMLKKWATICCVSVSVVFVFIAYHIPPLSEFQRVTAKIDSQLDGQTHHKHLNGVRSLIKDVQASVDKLVNKQSTKPETLDK